MGHPISDHFDVQTSADELAVARAELRNARALVDKLQTLLDSKTHAYEAMHNEAQQLANQLEVTRESNKFFASQLDGLVNTFDEVMACLSPHADAAVIEAAAPCVDGPVQIARHIVDKLITAPEPDIDTVPLADLLEAVGTYLEHDQAVTIRGSYEAVRQVEMHALGLTFCVDTHEASEALTKAYELGQCLTVQQA
ncbi:MAG: hypothetical protein KBG29_02640 [Pseudomonadales bacterium]|nr:hypothetical protein [Pseudomonadales bacterium]